MDRDASRPQGRFAVIPRVKLALRSGNKKTGPMPVSISERASCPSGCPLKGNGCCAESWPLNLHWDRVGSEVNGKPATGVPWERFCSEVAALPIRTVSGEPLGWRHNAAGDLPTDDRGNVDRSSMARLVAANGQRRGFTYTHHPLTTPTRETLAWVNVRGFTINVSHDSLADLDRGVVVGALPAVVVLPRVQSSDPVVKVRHTATTGQRVVTCPATYLRDGETGRLVWDTPTRATGLKLKTGQSYKPGDRSTTCDACMLCAKSDRSYAIGFPAHGNQARKADAMARRTLPVLGGIHAT